MMLSDGTIQQLLDTGDLVIVPMNVERVIQPASIDLRLGGHFLRIMQDGEFEQEIEAGGTFAIDPQECVLATTHEWVQIPRELVGRVEGKSTWGRKFLMVHSTAGFVDPGFRGQLTLELHNLSPRRLTLTVGQPIAQISFLSMDAPVLRPYGHPDLGSHYQHQTGATRAAC